MEFALLQVVKLLLYLFCFAMPSWLAAKEMLIAVNERDIYRYQDQAGEWQGKDIALVKAVFRRVPHGYRIIAMPWPRVLKSLEAGTVDMTLAAAKTPERQVYAWFSTPPFRYSHYLLFVRRDRLSLFSSIKSLRGLIGKDVLIGALRGAIYSDSFFLMLAEPGFKEKLVYIDDDQSMVSFALKGRVDAYIDSEIEGKHYLLRQPGLSELIVPLFQITSDEEAKSRLMFSKKTVPPLVVEQFNQALVDLHSSGEYQQISELFNPIANLPKAK